MSVFYCEWLILRPPVTCAEFVLLFVLPPPTYERFVDSIVFDWLLPPTGAFTVY